MTDTVFGMVTFCVPFILLSFSSKFELDPILPAFLLLVTNLAGSNGIELLLCRFKAAVESLKGSASAFG